MAIERREFLKKAGAGSIALASMPTLASLLARVASADEDDGGTGYVFLAFSQGATIDSVSHRVVMSGVGTIGEDGASGGGKFVHFDNTPAPPKPVLGAGQWRPRRLLSADFIGTWAGVFEAGIVEMDIRLIRETPSRLVIPATLKVVCNIGPGNLINPGMPAEGFTLTIPGAPFSPFAPIVPPLGLTVFVARPAEND